MVSDPSIMRQRNLPGSAGSDSDVAPVKTAPAAAKKHDHHDEEEEHDHDHPIDEEKLDNLLWEISKFCIPVGFILYLSIYLCYRHELYSWFTRSNSGLNPHSSHSVPAPLLASASAATVDAPAPSAGGVAEKDKFEKWVKKEERVAWAAMAANIGPEAGAADGVVVAASSKGEWEDEPDYHFTWTRDAALIISTFLPRFLPPIYLRPWLNDTSGDIKTTIHDLEMDIEPDYLVEPLIRAYISSQADIQAVQNPSGGLWDGGLNEPKFHVDGAAFNGNWGRPQRDGPALRALALIPYALFLLDRGYPADLTYVRDRLYDPAKLREVGKVIKNDLEEVGGGWWERGFDLWEEVNGQHLFTLLVSLRALQAGGRLATKLDDLGAAEFYLSQASKLFARLSAFWDDHHNYYLATITEPPNLTAHEDQMRIGGFAKKGRSGLDCAVPLAILHAGAESGEWSAIDDKVLSTLREYVLSFDKLYAVNKGKNWTEGWAVGRYKEDVYNGIGTSKGNPWFICTFSVSEMIYRAHTTFAQQQSSIIVTNRTIPFWSDILGAPVSSVPITDSAGLSEALEKLKAVGDAYLYTGSSWVTDDGRMSEQIHRWDGSQVGARDLTWSYASFLSAVRARRLL